MRIAKLHVHVDARRLRTNLLRSSSSRALEGHVSISISSAFLLAVFPIHRVPKKISDVLAATWIITVRFLQRAAIRAAMLALQALY